MSGPDLIPASFFERDALIVAKELLGMRLHRGPIALEITETEAYRWPDDSASHARSGKTARNAAMWGPPGRCYVFLCYGVHHMLNVVTHPEGEAAAVLLRSARVLAGLDVVAKRRRGRTGPDVAAGPGKLAQALGLDLTWNGHPLHEEGGLELRFGHRPARILAGPRVGIDYARPEHVRAPWRFASGDVSAVSRGGPLTEFLGEPS